MNKEVFILKTIGLHSTRGVVHIESIGFDPEDSAYIEIDARALLEDIPSLYKMAKQAIKQEEEYELKKYVDFKREIAGDYKVVEEATKSFAKGVKIEVGKKYSATFNNKFKKIVPTEFEVISKFKGRSDMPMVEILTEDGRRANVFEKDLKDLIFA